MRIPAGFGWYAYSPLTTTLRAPGTGLAAWLRLIIWLVLIGLWALGAIRVLRPPPRPAGEPSPYGLALPGEPARDPSSLN